MKKEDSIYSLKISKSPVTGHNCYSVFKKGCLLCMIDGDRLSMFGDDCADIEILEIPANPNKKVYRIGK